MTDVIGATDPPARRDVGPRDRMVRSALSLFCRSGVNGTGLREVLRLAQAPRGSLQHYFPGGKDQLVAEALELAGRTAARQVRRSQDDEHSLPPSRLLQGIVAEWQQTLEVSQYTHGCPLLAATADSSANSDLLRQATADAFRLWQAPIEQGLTAAGVPAPRAGELAIVVISAVEGAIVLARARQDLRPLNAVLEELGPLLDAAVEPAVPGVG